MDAVKMLDRLITKLHSMRRIDPLTECWLYTGCIERNGYGRMGYRGKPHSVHRLSAHIFFNFDLNSDEQINHRPLCPNKHCFNPNHLYVGNQSQNQLDIIRPETYPCGHPRTDMNTYTYTSLSGQKYNWCSRCRNKSRRSNTRNPLAPH